jgi:hypothetical protein
LTPEKRPNTLRGVAPPFPPKGLTQHRSITCVTTPRTDRALSLSKGVQKPFAFEQLIHDRRGGLDHRLEMVPVDQLCDGRPAVPD